MTCRIRAQGLLPAAGVRFPAFPVGFRPAQIVDQAGHSLHFERARLIGAIFNEVVDYRRVLTYIQPYG
jgi:hypothetical protein